MMMEVIDNVSRVLALLFMVFGFFGIKSWTQMRKIRKKERDSRILKIRAVTRALKARAEKMDASEYVVLDIVDPDGVEMWVPIFQDHWAAVFPGVSMMLMRRNGVKTICALKSTFSQTLPRHKHMRVERIYVMAGFVDVIDDNGSVSATYGAGETWEIPAGEFHACILRQALVNITYVPPLPDGNERKIDLDGAEKSLNHMN